MCALYSDCEKNLLEDEFIYAKEKADALSPVQQKFRLQRADARGAFHVEQPECCVCLLRNFSLIIDHQISLHFYIIGSLVCTTLK